MSPAFPPRHLFSFSLLAGATVQEAAVRQIRAAWLGSQETPGSQGEEGNRKPCRVGRLLYTNCCFKVGPDEITHFFGNKVKAYLKVVQERETCWPVESSKGSPD